jgi:hypothetical protein
MTPLSSLAANSLRQVRKRSSKVNDKDFRTTWVGELKLVGKIGKRRAIQQYLKIVIRLKQF